MRKRSLSSVWNKMLSKQVRAVARGMAQVGRQAAQQAQRQVLKKNAARIDTGVWTAGMVMSSAGARQYRLYRPGGVATVQPLPLLVMLHGCGQDAQQFALCTRMNRLAQQHGFMVLYPEQDRLANAQGCWNWFGTRSGRALGEVAWLIKAMHQVMRLYAVDGERVAVAGLSAGASMAALLAAEHPDVFKAVVMHSGVPPGAAHSTLTALGAMRGRRHSEAIPVSAQQPDTPWPPLLVIHGAKDAVVNTNNGESAAALWAGQSQAQAMPPRRVQRGQRYPMTVTDFKRKGRLCVRWVQIDHLGHAWSGGPARQAFCDPQGPDASRLLWAFVAQQFKA